MSAVPTSEQAAMIVQTIDSKGKAPKRRIATPAAALTAYSTARNIEIRRDARFGCIAGIFAGFPPNDPAEMEKMGQADCPNINFRQFEAKVNTYVGNWTAINAAGSEWAEVRADFPEDPMEEERRSKKLSYHLNCALKKWDSTGFANGADYVINSAIRDTQMGVFGIGIAFYEDHLDWRWKPIPTRKFLVPEGTLINLSNCPVAFIEDDMSVPDFYAMRNKAGWNEKAVLAVLFLQTNRINQVTGRAQTYAEWIEYIRENDAWQYSEFPPVRFIHVFTKEFTDNANKGSISHSIICDVTPPATASDDNKILKESAQGWIYDKTDVAERWSQIVNIFCDNCGLEGKYHGVKGYGDLIYDGCNLSNLMGNRIATGSILNILPMFKSSSENDRQKMQQFKWTPFGVLNPGIDLEQIPLKTDLNSALNFFNLNTNLINQNSRTFPQNDTTEGGEKPTATQVNFDRADQAQFTGLQINFYRSTGLDPMFAEQYRRLAQPVGKYPESWPGGHIAKEFRENCKKDGIPVEDLMKVKWVRSSRNTASGNMGVDVMTSDQLLGIATPGQGQLNARYRKACALVGSDAARAFVEMVEAPPTIEDVVIDQENLAIQSGQTPAAFGFQPHDKHLGPGMPNGHMTVLAQIEQVGAQLMEQGLETSLPAAEKLHGALLAGITHSEQHVAFMSELRRTGGRPPLFEQLVKEMNQAINTFKQFAETLGEAIEQAAQKAQPQQGNPEMMKAQAEIEIKKMKAEGEIEINAFKAQQKAENERFKMEAKAELQKMMAEFNLGLQAQMQALKLESDAAQKQQDLAHQTASATIDITKQAALGDQAIEQKKKEAELAAAQPSKSE